MRLRKIMMENRMYRTSEKTEVIICGWLRYFEL